MRSSCNPSCDQLAPATATRDHLRTPGAYSGLIPLLDKGSGTPIIAESLRFGKSECPAVRRVHVSGVSKHHTFHPRRVHQSANAITKYGISEQ